MEQNHTYAKLSDMTVEISSQKNRDMVILRGKSLLNEREHRMTFVQNPPRGVRSVEVRRTSHSRMVRRADGLYTLTFRFDASEKYLLSALQSEVRAVAKAAIDDYNSLKTHKKAQDEK